MNCVATYCSILIIFFCSAFQVPLNAQCEPDVDFPIAICEAFVNISLPASGVLTLEPGFIDAGSFDNCTAYEDLIFSVEPTTVSCADIGSPITVILYVTDEAGNTNSCWSEVTVEDKMSPLLICEEAITISLPESGVFALNEDILLNAYEDNCPLSFSINPTEVTCEDVGTTVPVIVTATDAGGNSNSCLVNVTVEDNLGPLLICRDLVNVQLEAGGALELTPDIVLDGFSDNCDLSFTISPSELSCSDKGDLVPYTIIATDGGGNSNTCSGNVFVENPKPTSVEIIGPDEIICGASGIVFNSIVTGGYAPFDYEWIIKKGASSGWVITSGQGTSSITMDAGTGKLKLKLKVFGICGKKKKDTYKITCIEEEGLDSDESSTAYQGSNIFIPENNKSSFDSEEDLLVYPNPTTSSITIHAPEKLIFCIQIFDSLGEMVVEKLSSKGSEQSTLSVQNLIAGVYYVKVRFKDGTCRTERFVKLKM